jgi:hypothetical protein
MFKREGPDLLSCYADLRRALELRNTDNQSHWPSVIEILDTLRPSGYKISSSSTTDRDTSIFSG